MKLFAFGHADVLVKERDGIAGQFDCVEVEH